jgi:hypothetical protein
MGMLGNTAAPALPRSRSASPLTSSAGSSVGMYCGLTQVPRRMVPGGIMGRSTVWCVVMAVMARMQRGAGGNGLQRGAGGNGLACGRGHGWRRRT